MVARLPRWGLAALVLAALCPAVASAASKKVATKVLTSAGDVAPGKDSGFTERCPKRFPHPVGTEFNGANDHIALEEAFALGRGHRSWDQAIFNFGDASEIFFTGPVCLRARGRFAYPTASGVVPPGGNATLTVTCPSSARRALNGTLAPATEADVGKIVMSKSEPDGPRGWTVGVRNLGAAQQSFRAGAVCTSGKMHIVRRSTDPFSVAAGQTDGGIGKCPKRARHPVAATFSAVDPTGEGQFTLAAVAEDDPGSLSALVTNRGQTTERAVVGEICVG
jgi:hypothetical protein